MNRLFAPLLLAAGARLFSVASYGQTVINSVPYTITQPGNYILNTNLPYVPLSGNAITVNSSDVTIDFNGHVLFTLIIPTPPFPTPSSSATAVALGTNNTSIENVTIKNGTITGFLVGINLSPFSATSTGCVVEGMRITKTEVGIQAYNSSYCLISNNYINGSDVGIEDSGFSDQIIRNRVVNSELGILTSEGYLENNFVANCPPVFRRDLLPNYDLTRHYFVRRPSLAES
jgi:parallel beta-helix repeat protein